MLTELTLTNFKAWKSISKMRLAPITGLFGTNSSGKSSILQFLLMLKQTAESADKQQVLYFGEEKSEKSFVVLGAFDDVVSSGTKGDRLSWRLDWDLGEVLRVEDPEAPRGKPVLKGDHIALSCDVRKLVDESLVVDAMAYDFDGRHFVMRRGSGAKGSGRYELAVEGEPFEFKRSQGRPPIGLEPPVKCYGFSDQVRAAFQNSGVLGDLEFAFEQQMQGVYHLGPLREYPFRDYRWSGAEPMDMGRRGEKVVAALLSAQQKGTTTGTGKGTKTIQHRVAEWLQKLGLIHAFTVEEIDRKSKLYRVSVQRSKDSPMVLLPDVGFGVSQVLPVIALCYYVPKGSTVLFEQPEIHLHPSVQSALADVFIDAALKRKVQIVVESHSEHLLRRLQRRIAEEKLKLEDAALYFCDAVNGSSLLRPLDVDMFGDIRNWPKGFFGNDFEDTAAMLKAKRERRAAQAS